MHNLDKEIMLREMEGTHRTLVKTNVNKLKILKNQCE